MSDEPNVIDEQIDVIDPDIVVKSMTVKATSDNKDDRTFSGVCSTASIDRQSEQVESAGIDTRAYMSLGGPILAASHFSESFASGFSSVVARALRLTKSKDQLVLNKGEFDTDPISEHYRGKVQRGFLRGFSISFIPRDVDYRQTRAGRQIRVVNKSELIHILITGMPVNTGSLIAAKSLARIEKLENRISQLSTAFDPSKLDAVATDIANLSAQVETLKSLLTDKPEVSVDAERSVEVMNGLLASADSLLEAAFKAAHPELPDAAFIIEKGAEREGGKVLRKYRHLPHHTGAVKSPTEHTTINKALLRNALARVNQVKPAKESREAFIARATRHLRAHANALGIGKKD